MRWCTLRRTIDLDSVDETIELRQAALFEQLGIVDVAEPSVTV